MFTGIVQHKGRVAQATPTPAGVRFEVDRQGWDPPLDDGDSVCVSGVCLTVVHADERTIAFDVIAETLSKTTLGDLAEGTEGTGGSSVNLEPSLTPNTPMSGHFVQGHVEGVGRYTAVTMEGEDCRLTIKPPADLIEYIVPEGSITLDGVSMTVADVHEDTFEVALIPTTIEMTTLGEAQVGGGVNLESDIISRTIVHWLRLQQGSGEGVTMDLLREAGFASQ